MTWTEDQIKSFSESERKIVTLTLKIDENGILSLTKAMIEFQGYINKIETLDTRTKKNELNRHKNVRSHTIREPHQSTKIKNRIQHDAVRLEVILMIA